MIGGLIGIATSRAGLLAIAFAGIILFYEGVPLGPLRWIPFVGPVLASVADGRVDRERERGALSERLVWQEQQRKLLVKRLAEDKAKQAELDAIAARYHDEVVQRAAEQSKIAALEAALNEEDKNAPPGPGSAVIPRRVSKQLNAVGR